jgi:hypothetical protein
MPFQGGLPLFWRICPECREEIDWSCETCHRCEACCECEEEEEEEDDE